jgi:hypothetical protein
MTDIWTYRISALDESLDLTGFGVEALDGHIGKVDTASSVAGDAYVVVDTGFWIFGKRRMIPARMVSQLDVDEEKIWIDMTKQQVKDAPDYDDQVAMDEKRRADMSSYYTNY